MIIVRAINNETGEIYEINSNSHPELRTLGTTRAIITCSICIFNDILNNTDHDFDTIEVVAK